MKNIFKISIVFFIGLSITLSSCKKEDEVVAPTVIYGCTDPAMFNYDPSATANNGTCIPILLGCLDNTASNFNPLANTDDGSCLPSFYDIALGIWNITSECEDLTISIPLLGDFDVPLVDMFPETIEIVGEGNSVVSLDINDNDVLADIENNGTVTIQDNQTILFDTGDFDPTGTIGMVEVDITGSGTIVTASNGDMLLNLAFSILSIPADADCEITFTK
tara:strand:+ start:329 stop:988 length:660 start_codon:yes stop_codon:yes gene_type:complete